ncbi:MAG: hypothetical protein K8R74_00795 [Bacteroidales bacterium]|nr:hypothetical protein [Bacteroidales bacterium]
MSSARLRPRYRITSSLSSKEVLEKIQKKLNSNEFPVSGQTIQEHAFIRIPEKDQHYWSPELHVWIREQDGETIIYGVMGPKPKIWTMFMFFYTAVLTLWFFGSSYGIIQLWLGMKAPFLWSIPMGLLAIVLVYGAAKYGQYKGKAQMELLKNFLEGSVKKS